MEITPILKKIGLTDKEVKIYLILLENGPLSVRGLAQESSVNRGTVYDILKYLRELGLVSYYHKNTKQLFVAENPERLIDVLEERKDRLEQVGESIVGIIPILKSLYGKAGKKPVVKYYEGNRGVKTILQDVLSSTGSSADKIYNVFSSSGIREYIYKAWPGFTSQRIRMGIKINVIAIGHKGTKAKLSERRTLSLKGGLPTYILIYNGKVAMISVNEEKELLGLIVEDKSIFQTQLQIFKFIWQTL